MVTILNALRSHLEGAVRAALELDLRWCTITGVGLVVLLSLSGWPGGGNERLPNALFASLLACCGLTILVYATQLAEAKQTISKLHANQQRLVDFGELSRMALESLDLQETLDAAVALVSTNLDADCRAIIELATTEASLVPPAERVKFDTNARPKFGISIEAAQCRYGLLAVYPRDGKPLNHDGVQLAQKAARIVAAVIHHTQAGVAREAREAELEHRAFHDPLTGLPNRALFNDRLKHAIARAERDLHSTAVLFIDLDEFKAINDTLGHLAGDHVLFQVADRLMRCRREGDTVARMGGDEFAVILEQTTEAEAAQVAARIEEALTLPLVIHEQQIRVRASIGIAIASADRPDADGLVEQADLAMYSAKRQRRR